MVDMRSGGADDFKESGREAGEVIDEVESW